MLSTDSERENFPQMDKWISAKFMNFIGKYVKMVFKVSAYNGWKALLPETQFLKETRYLKPLFLPISQSYLKSGSTKQIGELANLPISSLPTNVSYP